MSAPTRAGSVTWRGDDARDRDDRRIRLGDPSAVAGGAVCSCEHPTPCTGSSPSTSSSGSSSPCLRSCRSADNVSYYIDGALALALLSLTSTLLAARYAARRTALMIGTAIDVLASGLVDARSGAGHDRPVWPASQAGHLPPASPCRACHGARRSSSSCWPRSVRGTRRSSPVPPWWSRSFWSRPRCRATPSRMRRTEPSSRVRNTTDDRA